FGHEFRNISSTSSQKIVCNVSNTNVYETSFDDAENQSRSTAEPDASVLQVPGAVAARRQQVVRII
ncbi:MAG: hypothetical protein ACREQ3_23730, partial [Candidatus Binatia bacterium]